MIIQKEGCLQPRSRESMDTTDRLAVTLEGASKPVRDSKRLVLVKSCLMLYIPPKWVLSEFLNDDFLYMISSAVTISPSLTAVRPFG